MDRLLSLACCLLLLAMPIALMANTGATQFSPAMLAVTTIPPSDTLGKDPDPDPDSPDPDPDPDTKGGYAPVR